MADACFCAALAAEGLETGAKAPETVWAAARFSARLPAAFHWSAALFLTPEYLPAERGRSARAAAAQTAAVCASAAVKLVDFAPLQYV